MPQIPGRVPIRQATVVSLLPYEINENKPQIIPANFHIDAVPAGEVRVIQIDVVDRTYYVDSDRGMIAFAENPEVVAKSIAEDHVRASILSDFGHAQPGLFYVIGLHDEADIKKNFVKDVEHYTKLQKKWYEKLVKRADDSWQRFRQHRLITDMHRRASQALGLKREWADEVSPADQIECPYCTTLISNRAIVCPQCRGPVNPEKLAAMPEAVVKILFGGMPQVPQVNRPVAVVGKPLGG